MRVRINSRRLPARKLIQALTTQILFVSATVLGFSVFTFVAAFAHVICHPIGETDVTFEVVFMVLPVAGKAGFFRPFDAAFLWL